ncbi:MAG: xylan 1,4-beta-xylosidase [Lachnospiraceae bacterium]|nr:xylan 1,4-beta-xylosidase [Candidatus Colinaster equi]
MITNIKINPNDNIFFRNNVDSCIGTGRLGLALTKEYLDELQFVQEEIGFKLIRGHGLFCDDVAIYHEYEEDGVTKVEYNYTYIDRIFDKYLELNIRPYLELGFMPYKMASGTQTIFYWKGNTTPPKDYKLWTDMVIALLAHLKKRYGNDVHDWPIEVWNEPNLPGFWYKADMQEYFKLFKETFLAIKAFDPAFKVGGPAICGVNDEEWIRAFLDFCKKEHLDVDYITRHHYTVDFPTRDGHYDYSTLEDSDMRIANLATSRAIIDSFDEFRSTPMHITEFSTSYTPKGVIHDTNLNAAYIAGQLSRLGESCELYSYWTFGDVFEEQGVQFTPFNGGFGLVAEGNIPKPTFYTFQFFKNLKKSGNQCVYRDGNTVMVKGEQGYAGILWNVDSDAYTRHITIPVDASEYSLIVKSVDEDCCNPLKLWHDLGEPHYLTDEQKKLLKDSAKPLIKSDIVKPEDGIAAIDINVKTNAVVYFELNRREFTPDRGYDYEKVINYH